MSKKPHHAKQSAQRTPTSEKLARALEQAKAPDTMIERARAGEYDDYKSDRLTPIIDLIRDAQLNGLPDIATRAMAGEFDGQRWEAEEWRKSPEGRATFKEFGL